MKFVRSSLARSLARSPARPPAQLFFKEVSSARVRPALLRRRRSGRSGASPAAARSVRISGGDGLLLLCATLTSAGSSSRYQLPAEGAGLLCSSYLPGRTCQLRPKLTVVTMDDTSRRWVLRSLSPPLHPRDLRSVTGPSGGRDDFSSADRARPDARDERPPDSPGGSSGSRDGFFSLVDDPTSPEAELNEAWMLSPRRRVHLATLKEDGAFKVQTYAGGKKTQSLFRDSESRSRVRPESRPRVFGEEEEEEEKRLRKEIIRKQAPKRNSTCQLSERLSALEKSDWSRPTNTPTKGYGPVPPEPPRPVDPGAIDRAQIDFGAARQRFLEREKRDVLVHPRRPRASRKMEGEDATGSESGKVQTLAENEQTSAGPSGVPSDPGSLAAVEACPGSVGGEGAFGDGVAHESDDRDETPIEKEISWLLEREENLRRARGLKHSDGFSELLEIQSGRAPSPGEAQKKSRGSFTVQLQSHGKNVSGKGPQEPSDTEKQFREDPRDQKLPLSPCCPHRHAEETSCAPSPTTPPPTPPPPRHVPSRTATLSWRSNRESAGLERRKKRAPDFIEKEIQEALRRERELRESRRSRESSESGESRERGESGLRSATPLAGRASEVDPIRRSGMSQRLASAFHQFLHDQHKFARCGRDTSVGLPTSLLADIRAHKWPTISHRAGVGPKSSANRLFL